MNTTLHGLETALSLAQIHRDDESDLDYYIATLRELIKQEENRVRVPVKQHCDTLRLPVNNKLRVKLPGGGTAEIEKRRLDFYQVIGLNV